MKTTAASQADPAPHTLIVTWDSGQETLNLDEIHKSLRANRPDATANTTEYRAEEMLDVVYKPLLAKTENGFSLTYDHPGYWVDKSDALRKANGELGVAVYHQEGKNGKVEWICTWFRDGGSKKGLNIPCESSAATRDYKEVKVKVRNARFREIIFGSDPKCLITGETNPDILEAAHINEVQNDGRELFGNGLVLRADIHKLFDKNILTVDEDGKFTVHPVPDSYIYLFEEDMKTWKGGQPRINPNLIEKYVENIRERNKNRALKNNS